jgi:hypothetical protein
MIEITPMHGSFKVGDTVIMPARLSNLKIFGRWLQSLWLGYLPPKPMAEYRIISVNDCLAEYDFNNPTLI